MIDQRINDSLKELEQSLKNIDSARKQVEKIIESYDGLHDSASEYVAQLKKTTTKVEELIAAVGTDYKQKVEEFDKDCKSIIESANSASQKLSEATDSFNNSLNTIEGKQNYSMMINIVLAIILGSIIVLFIR